MTALPLQTLRIGANIIDQWDADSYPTTITYYSQSLILYTAASGVLPINV